MWGKVLGGSRTPAVAAIACCCGILAAGASLFFYHQREERKRASKPGDGFARSSSKQQGDDDLLKEWKQQFALKKEREQELLLRTGTKLWWARTDQGPIYLELDKQFKMRKTIGSGGYGVVVSAWDTKKKKNVAIKKVASAFDDTLVAKRIIREVRLLRQLDHPNIIGLVDVLPPPSVGKFNDVYMVLQRMETDLSNMSIDHGHNLHEVHFQSIMYQILCGVSYMHSARVIHRDLKPENVLINRNGDVKICDFGLARSFGPDVEDPDSGGDLEPLTEYVGTRWWRAPEVLLDTNYGTAIDVWSAGCIMAEMLQREPLFMGSDTAEMLRLVIQFTGKPSRADLSFVTSRKTRNYVLDMTEGPRTPLPERFPGVGSDALDLMARLLAFSPSRRISLRDAMRHPWFAGLYEDDDETPAPEPADLAAVENLPQTRPNLQQLMFQEVCEFRPECRAMAPGGDMRGPVPSQHRVLQRCLHQLPGHGLGGVSREAGIRTDAGAGATSTSRGRRSAGKGGREGGRESLSAARL